MATNPIKTEAAAYVSHGIDQIQGWDMDATEWLEGRGAVYDLSDNEFEDYLNEFGDRVDGLKAALQHALAGIVDGN